MGNAVMLPDHDARRQITEDLDRCLLVEAGAGSGKTASLVLRILALVREGKCRISTIAAVTFTRKAAAEMKGRLQVSLEKAWRDETTSDKKERLGQGLKEIDKCFIGTIHSFCGQLLRERPIEAGIDPEFLEMDELEDRRFCREVWQEYLMECRSDNHQAIERLLEIQVDMRDLEHFYMTICTYPEVEIVAQSAPYPHLEPTKAAFDVLMKVSARHWPQGIPSDGPDALQSILAQMKQHRDFLGIDNDLRFLKALEIMEKTGNIILKRWDTPDDAKTVKKAYDLYQDEHVKPILRQWREYRHEQLINFVLPAVRRCGQKRVREGRLNYQDLLILALQLLKHNSEVRKYFQEQYTHLLVDEFQDTDPLQAEIMLYLTGQETDELDWRKLTPQPGSLFVVGDPKQSIYRFRRADIDTYNEVRRLIKKSGGQILNLTTNFRSLDGIGRWVNQSFAELLPESADQFQAGFNPLDTVRVCGGGDLGGIHKISIPRVSRHTQETIAVLDAQRIARWIRIALDGGITLTRTDQEIASGIGGTPRPQDFMIIFRYKSHLNIYAQALEEYGIPYKISGGDGFAESPELIQMIRLLRSLLDPEDPIRLLAVLRGPLFGLSDNQLLRFRRAGGKFNFQGPVPDDLAPEDTEAFSWTFRSLQQLRGYLMDLPASAALRRIVVETGLLPMAAAGELGKSRAGYVLQALELLTAVERSGMVSPLQLVEYLEALREQGVEEEISVTPKADDAVRLMNLHKAKGLEAEVVFLAHPGKTVSHEPTGHIKRQDGVPRGYFVVESRTSLFHSQVLGYPLDWDNFLQKEREYAAAEEIRLLYVAATRGKNLLVISCYEGKPENSPWMKLEQFCAGVPELEEITVKRARIDKVPGLVMDDLEKARHRFFNTNAPVTVPSYSTTTVKRASDSLFPRTAGERKGKGTEWGGLIHQALAVLAADPRPDPELLFVNVLAEEELSAEETDEAILLLKGIIQSPVWQRMARSSQRFMEIPFATTATDDILGIPMGTAVSGVIDLVFKEAGEWVIADYKTDAIETPQRLTELKNYYAPQVRLYKRFWETLTGEKVKEAGLYFTAAKKWIEV
ncbi:MAG: UvrD-helicase domain-containing protein [Syntrophomonadaceae bacterium]|nr:UvrD-helicase domain-containing protein [Syntrophomonadaceae bacterium]